MLEAGYALQQTVETNVDIEYVPTHYSTPMFGLHSGLHTVILGGRDFSKALTRNRRLS